MYIINDLYEDDKLNNKFFMKGAVNKISSKNILLHEAINKGNIKRIKLLLKYGANINLMSIYNESPLQCAIKKQNLKMVKFLISQGANINNKTKIDYYQLYYEYTTNLHTAVMTDNVEITKCLLDKGADVSEKDFDRRTPLCYAILSGNLEIVELLLQFGAIVESKHCILNSSLYTSITLNNKEIFKLLLNYEENLNFCLSVYFTYLLKSSFHKNDLLDLLLDHMLKLDSLYSKPNHFLPEWLNIQREKNMLEQKTKYDNEIEQMKVKICDKYFITYYDILKKPFHDIKPHLINRKIKSKLKTGDYISLFPFYSTMMMCRIKRMLREVEIIEKGHEIISSIIPLPETCISIICNYLNVNDFRMLINVFQV